MPSASPTDRARSRRAAALGAALAFASPVWADAAGSADAQGWRSRLQAAGLRLDAGYIAELASNRSGGIRRG